MPDRYESSGLRRLEYFVAVAREEHFGRAAARLRVAQPALTRQVRKLEEELQTPLFERLPRGVRLTAAGRTFLTDCERLLADMRRAIGNVRAVGRGDIGALRLGFVEVAAWRGVVPDSIRALRKHAPGIALELLPASSIEQIDAMRDNRLDAGFVYNPVVDERQFEIHNVAVHGVLGAVPEGSVLAAKGRVRLRELTAEPFIMFPRAGTPVLYDALTAAFRKQGLAPNIVSEEQTEAAILALVAAGGCVAVSNSCNRWRHPNGVAFVEISDVTIPMRLCLVHRRDNRSPSLSRFVGLALEKSERPKKASARK